MIQKRKARRHHKVHIITSKYFALHKGSPTHPERPARIASSIKALESFQSSDWCFVSPRQIPIETARLVHSEDYLDAIRHLPVIDRFLAPSAHIVCYETNDMFWNKYTSACALFAAGSVDLAVERVLSRQTPAAFALVRPPGHHAGTQSAEGFSWLNNVAIAARNALRRPDGLVKKVLIFDWDVHHGNGTQSVFHRDKAVLYISLHRFGLGFYPGTGHESQVGSGEGEGFSVNIPWRQRRLGDAEYMAAFLAVVKPIAREFSPDLVLVSAGFDAAEGDALGQMEVSAACFGWMAAEAFALAGNRNCVFALEGGYSRKALSCGVLACVDAVGRASNGVHLAVHEGIDEDSNENTDLTLLMAYCQQCAAGALQTIADVCDVQKTYWPSVRRFSAIVENALAARKGHLKPTESVMKSGDKSSDYFSGLGALSSFMNGLYSEQ